jgi:chromosome segregation ATPase
MKHLHFSAQESDAKRIHAEDDLKETKTRFESLETSARVVEEEAALESTRRHELEGKLKLNEGKLQDLTSSLQSERTKVEELKKKLEVTVEEKESVIIELENDANKILAELQDAAEKEEELLVRIEELESKLADRNLQLKTLKTQVAKATGGDAEALTSDHFEDLEKLEKEHQRREANLESVVATARKERDDIRNRLENDIVSIRGEKERLERQVASQSESVRELEVKCRSLTDEVDLWKEKSHDLEATAKASENELKKVKDRLDVEVEKDSMNAQRVTLLLAEIEHMQNEHDELEKSHQAAMAKKVAVVASETKVVVDNENTRRKLEAAQKEVSSLTELAEKAELECQKYRRKLQTLSSKCGSQDKRIVSMEGELSESVKTTSRTKRDLVKKRKECEDLKLKLEEVNQRVESMHLVQESVYVSFAPTHGVNMRGTMVGVSLNAYIVVVLFVFYLIVPAAQECGNQSRSLPCWNHLHRWKISGSIFCAPLDLDSCKKQWKKTAE